VKILETDRLDVRQVTDDDAEFILGLLNEPSWLRFIGDKGVRTLDDARDYIRNGPVASYQRFGFGLYMTRQKSDGARIGLCGLLKRDALPDVDIGFALLPAYWGKGYALEAAAAVMEHGRAAHGLRRIVAITNPDNERSIQLLAKLGMRQDGTVRISDPGLELKYFVRDLEQPGAALSGHMSDLLVRELEGLRREIALFPDDESVWRTVPGIANSAANLALHVAGNLQHFVGRVLGGTSYVRNRELEFGRTSGSKDDVIRELQAATTVVRITLARLDENRLATEFPERHAGMRFQTDRFLLHLCTHAAFHLGQAGIVRRAVTGDARSSGPIPLKAIASPPPVQSL
jgi:RimJ/RimL family protein N-acetyltransferase